MQDLLLRATRARPELTAELVRRGFFTVEEKAELFRQSPKIQVGEAPVGPVRFASMLAHGDSQLAARVVLRDVLAADELRWLDRLLRFQDPSDKRDELVRIVERAIEKGRNSDVCEPR